jgi:hypothetical protein
MKHGQKIDSPSFWIIAFVVMILLSARFWLLVILLAALCWLTPAQAHSFYPYECCHDRDCWPMGLDADAREPEPVETATGWRLHDGIVIPFSETRPSPDGRFHVCRGGGWLEGPVIAPSGRKPCLWAPAPSS